MVDRHRVANGLTKQSNNSEQWEDLALCVFRGETKTCAVQRDKNEKRVGPEG